jgi:hypothetical protein
VRTERWRAGVPIHLGAIRLLPIERTVTRALAAPHGGWLAVAHEACALVVRDGAGTRVLDAGAGADSLESLRERLPELESLLVTL